MPHWLNKKRVLYYYGFFGVAITVLFLWHYPDQMKQKEGKRDTTQYTQPHVGDHYRLYNKEAKVTLVNYFSFDCVHCNKAYLMEDTLLSSLPEKVTKNINIVYRHNPLLSQPLSKGKALIGECVARQSGDARFFAFMQESFATYKNSSSNDWFVALAKKYVSSQDTLTTCLNDSSVKAFIQQQKNDNVLSDITYTPTVLIFREGEFIHKYDRVGENVVHEVLKYYLYQNK